MRYPGGDEHVLSGLMRGANEIRNRPAIVDQPSGKGRVILFAGNPCYRWQNFGEFNMLFNTVLNFNDIKTERAEAVRHRRPAVAQPFRAAGTVCTAGDFGGKQLDPKRQEFRRTERPPA